MPQTTALLHSTDNSIVTELTDVPFFPQKAYQCGPAALATVLQYQGIDVLPDDLVDQVYLPERKGSLQTEMIAAARQQGLMAYVIDPNLQALFTQVQAGYPVLILQNLGMRWLPFWHYAVVIGVDLPQQQIILRSGETERWITTLSTFERTWARGDYWGIIITKPDNLPAQSQLSRWLASAHDLEQTNQHTAALKAYQTAIREWPEAVEPVIAATNLLYQQQHYQTAENVFHHSLTVQPNQAALWNNRAYILQALSCHQAALKSAQCAAQLSPNNDNIQATLRDMQSLPEKLGKQCPAINCP